VVVGFQDGVRRFGFAFRHWRIPRSGLGWASKQYSAAMMPGKMNPLVGFLAPDDILRRAPEIGMAPVTRMIDFIVLMPSAAFFQTNNLTDMHFCYRVNLK
jgi:hypothetical protein